MEEKGGICYDSVFSLNATMDGNKSCVIAVKSALHLPLLQPIWSILLQSFDYIHFVSRLVHK